MKYIKKFEIFEKSPTKPPWAGSGPLSDLPYPKNIERRDNLNVYKYKVNDIVYHKELETIFIVKSINDGSENQDYYLFQAY